MEPELTDAEKVEIYNANLKKYDSNFTFDMAALEEETNNSEYMEYINWETNFTKRMNEVGYVSKPTVIQGEVCQHCNAYGQANIFESVGQLIKHMYKCKYNPQNMNKINNICFDCEFCALALSNLHNKTSHERLCKSNPKNHKGIYTYSCEYCQKIVTNMYAKNTHELACKSNPINHKDILAHSCEHCEKPFTNMYAKNNHELACKSNPINKDKNKIINCEYCNKIIDNEYNYTVHVTKCKSNPKIIEDEELQNIQRIQKLKDDHEKLTCRGCNRFLKHQMLYDLHIKQCKKYSDYVVNEALKAENEYTNIDFDTITDSELQILLKNTLQ